MKDNKESHPIYIAIDSAKIARCKWCGTAECENWSGTKTGLYCSSECHDADQSLGYIYCFILTVICSSLIIGLALAGGGRRVDFDSVLLVSFPLILLACPFLMCGVRSLKSRQKIQYGSRRNEVYSKTALLKALPSTVSCPRCGGNIDLTKLEPDRSYACEYCGAFGTIEIIKTNKLMIGSEQAEAVGG